MNGRANLRVSVEDALSGGSLLFTAEVPTMFSVMLVVADDVVRGLAQDLFVPVFWCSDVCCRFGLCVASCVFIFSVTRVRYWIFFFFLLVCSFLSFLACFLFSSSLFMFHFGAWPSFSLLILFWLVCKFHSPWFVMVGHSLLFGSCTVMSWCSVFSLLAVLV